LEERRTVKYMLAFSPSERDALQRLANHERLPAAAVVRRLVWNEARRHGLTPAQGALPQPAGEVRQ
jgi:hypothetical protein